MRRRMTISLAMLVGLAMLGAVVAQAQQSAPPQPAPRPMTPPGAATPAPEMPKEVQINGTVSKVDPLAKTVGVSTGFFGLFGATVRVADDTQIRVQGQPATLTEIKEGARVKASYEVRDGKNLAKSIDVVAEEKKQPAAVGVPGRMPGSAPPQ